MSAQVPPPLTACGAPKITLKVKKIKEANASDVTSAQVDIIKNDAEPKRQSIHTKNGTIFENNVVDFINALRDLFTLLNVSKDDIPPESEPEPEWKKYIRRIFQHHTIQHVKKTNSFIGRTGNTEDIVVRTSMMSDIKISCKHNNTYLSHPRVRTFLSHEYRERYDAVKSSFNSDPMRKVKMVDYYLSLAILTKEYIETNFLQVFRFLYPSDIHLVHNKKTSVYFPMVVDPTGVVVVVEEGKGNSRGKSVCLLVSFTDSVTFKMRIHNSEGDKACIKDNPFKWEVEIKK